MVKFSENFINLHIDAEKGEGPDLAKRYYIRGFPTTIFTDPRGNEVDRLIGYTSAENYLKIMQDYYAGRNTLQSFLNELESNPDSLELRMKVIEKFNDRGNFSEVIKHSTYIIEHDQENRSGKLPEVEYYRARAIMITENNPEAMRRVAERYGEEPIAERALRELGRYYQMAKEPEKELEVIRELINRDPDNPRNLNLFAWRSAGLKLAMDEGLRYIDKALTLVPDSLAKQRASLLDTKAELLWRMDKPDQAVEIIQEALKLQPEDEYLKKQLKKFKGEQTE